MTTKWGQRWTGAALGPGGTKFGGALRAEKRKEGLSQEAPRENKRSLKVCTSVLFSFFFFFTMKDSRLEDLWIVTVCFARRGRSWATEGGCRRHLWGGQQTRPEVCWTKTCHLGRFSLAALTFWIYNTFFTKCSKSQWSWILTYLPLKCLLLSLL